MNEIILHKPNQLIEIIGNPISNLSLITYNYILHKLQKEKTNFIRLTLSELSHDINRNSYAYEDVYKVLKNLLDVRIVSIDKRGKNWGGFSLISAFKRENDCVYIEVPNLILNELLRQEDLYYTTIKLLEEKSFKCAYSIVFYEIFKKYEKIEIPYYSIDTLRSLTETTTKYKVYADFKKRVIVPALKEINSFDTNYIYDYEEEYFGRRVDKIRFIKKNKEKNQNIQSKIDISSLSDELLKAIEKARKNRFINDKFSQRAVEKAITQYNEALVIKALYKLYNFENKVSSFTKLLNSTIQEVINLNEVEQEMKRRKQKELEEQKEDDLSELDRFKSLILSQAKGQISIEEWSKLSIALIKLKTEEEVKNFISNHELLINYKLF